MKHIKTFESFLNEADTLNVKPNVKLEKETGFPYAAFYLSTQATNIMIDFANPDHVELIKLIADQAKIIDGSKELSPSDIQKGRKLFKKALGENVVYSKQDGADCGYRLLKTPNVDLALSNQEFYNDNQKMTTFI